MNLSQKPISPDNRIILSSEQRDNVKRKRNHNYSPRELPEGLTPEEEERQAYLENIRRHPPIDEKAIREANYRLEKYASASAHMRKRLIRNESYWKLRQWKYYGERNRDKKDESKEIPTAWLWNCIVSKLADLIEGYPEANIRPKRRDDTGEATKLKSILPVICEENNYESVYASLCLYLLKQGTTCAGVFWDGNRHDGLGDVAINKIDLLELFWASGITDIQDSPEVFHTKLTDNQELERIYPELKGKLGSNKFNVVDYDNDDTIDKTNKSTVIDWYYKKVDSSGNSVLHLCKYVEDVVLFASENDPENFPNGYYEHGLYPFVTEALFEVENELTGYGYVDIGEGDQHAIDIITNAVLTNAKVCAKPRFFVRQNNSGVNEDELTDLSRDLIHVAGNFNEDNVRRINPPSMPSYIIDVRDRCINELKETLGNRDVNNGGTVSGITAASAIATMQEQGGKLSREHNKRMYSLHKKVINMVIELIRQFYELPREYRITGTLGEDMFISYDNSGLQPQPQPSILGVELGLRLPCFDIEVSAQKASSYSKMEQNELAIQLYNLGVFSPQNADMAAALLKTMDFAHKDEVLQLVMSNGTMLQKYQQLQSVALQLANIVDGQNNTNYTQGLMQAVAAESGQSTIPQESVSLPELNSDGTLKSKEHPFVERARAQAQSSTQVEQ